MEAENVYVLFVYCHTILSIARRNRREIQQGFWKSHSFFKNPNKYHTAVTAVSEECMYPIRMLNVDDEAKEDEKSLLMKTLPWISG